MVIHQCISKLLETKCYVQTDGLTDIQTKCIPINPSLQCDGGLTIAFNGSLFVFKFTMLLPFFIDTGVLLGPPLLLL